MNIINTMEQSYYEQLKVTLPENTLQSPFTVELINNVWMNLNHMIEKQLKSDLSTGRSDNDLIPFSSKEITNYIKTNRSVIDKVIVRMLTEYICDKDEDPNEIIEDLKNPEKDWIREYLYEYLDPFKN